MIKYIIYRKCGETVYYLAKDFGVSLSLDEAILYDRIAPAEKIKRAIKDGDFWEIIEVEVTIEIKTKHKNAE